MTNQINDPQCSFDVEAFINIDEKFQSLFSSNELNIIDNNNFILSCCLTNFDLISKLISNPRIKREYTKSSLSLIPAFTILFDFNCINAESNKHLNNYNIDNININELDYKNSYKNFSLDMHILTECSLTKLKLSLMPGRRVVASDIEGTFKSISKIKY